MDGDAAVGMILPAQVLNVAFYGGTDVADGIVGLDFFKKDVPHLIVGAEILDLTYQFVFHSVPPVKLILVGLLGAAN